MAAFNGIGIQMQGKRQQALPYIYSNGSWRLGIPYVHSNGSYRATCVLEEAEITSLFMMTASDSYRGGWRYFEDEDPRQGYDGMSIYGVIWFDIEHIKDTVKDRLVDQAKLRLHMHDGYGRGVGVEVQLYGTNKVYDGRSGTPELLTAYGTLPGSANPDEITEFSIPTQAITDMLNGTICALVLKSADASLYNDRPYSKNYARFSGSTSATVDTAPCLTVVHCST